VVSWKKFDPYRATLAPCELDTAAIVLPSAESLHAFNDNRPNADWPVREIYRGSHSYRAWHANILITEVKE